jgi:hypothetical protein
MALMSWSTCAACVLGVGEYKTMQPAFELMVGSDAGRVPVGFQRPENAGFWIFGAEESLRKGCHRII